MVDFGNPTDETIMRLEGIKRWVAHWSVDDFDAAAPTFNWGPRFRSELLGHVFNVDSLAMIVIEGAPVAVDVAPVLFTHASDTIGISLDPKSNVATTTPLTWTSLNIPIDFADPYPIAGHVNVTDYAATDDLRMSMWGSALETDELVRSKLREQTRTSRYIASIGAGEGRRIPGSGGEPLPPR